MGNPKLVVGRNGRELFSRPISHLGVFIMSMYDADSLYHGTITGQELCSTRDQDPQLRITVSLTHKLRSKNEADGMDELPEEAQLTKTIYYNFKPNMDQLERNFRDLRNFGLTSPSIELFNLDHPKAINLAGKTVTLKPRFSDDPRGGPKKDWWNIVFPAARAPKISLDAIAKYKIDNESVLKAAYQQSVEARQDKVPF